MHSLGGILSALCSNQPLHIKFILQWDHMSLKWYGKLTYAAIVTVEEIRFNYIKLRRK